MLTSDEIDFIERVVKSVRNESLITFSDTEDTDDELYNSVTDSLLLNGYNEIEYYRAFDVSKSGYEARLFIVKTGYSILSTKRVQKFEEIQLIGLKRLNNNFGHIFIRPETLEDKINELFQKNELDFKEYPGFSKKYYFLADNPLSGKFFATSQRLELLEKQNKIIIEVKDNILVAKYPRVFNEEDFANLLNLIIEI